MTISEKNDWQQESYLSLATQKRDGTFVNTPVWFANNTPDAKVFYIYSESKAWKVKRIRNFSHVKICPCTVTGKLTGSWQTAQAEILNAEEAKTAYSYLRKRYTWKYRLIDLAAKVSGKFDKRAFIRITLDS